MKQLILFTEPYFEIKSWRWLIICLYLSLSACQHPAPPEFKEESSRYFAETGYTVRGEFLYFYNIYGGNYSLGSPLSEEILNDGWKVQYFEKGRLEYHPENEPAYRITVGWLGELLHRRRPPIPTSEIPRADAASRRYYPQTGHTLSGDFLHYFDLHGGTVRFGLPISEPFLLEGQLAQDFQSARFLWTPETPGGIRLENIGQLHLEQIRGAP